MATMYVIYAGDAGPRFDRDYRIGTHLPLVRETWGPRGLQSVAGFFPAGDGAGKIAVAVRGFRDRSDIEAALDPPETGRVVADVENHTDAEPSRSLAASL